MDSTGTGGVLDGRHPYRKRRRTLISCTECHRRKQKCDRQRPCQNCKKRCKPHLCHYEAKHSNISNSSAVPTYPASSSGSSIGASTPRVLSQIVSETNHLSSQDHRHLVSVLGYSTHNVHNTFSLVNRIGATDVSRSCPPDPEDAFDRKQTALDDKYRSLIRQLPLEEYIDVLVQQFFSEINWQYDVLDEITFRRQLESWRRHPYSAHSRATDSLPTDILAFPSLLSQVVAHALIYQPSGERANSSLESLKYAPEMTFVDLAHDFSEVGHSIVGMIQETKLSIVAVQSGILRASFLKNIGSVVQAWHVVGITIRHAQELGLHVGVPAPHSLVRIDDQWNHEMQRRVWFVLHNWDVHMAVVLGRPITTSMATEIMDLPDDLAQREIGKPPRKRTDQDTPTPSSVIRVGYDIAYRYFPQIRELEDRGARIEDYHVVRETHAAIVGNMNRLPRWCRCDDPDVHLDESSGCRWLAAARQSLASGIHFVLLSLHRPYIFNVRESRTEALKVALTIIVSQKRLFRLSEPKQYLAFDIVYPLFDALVISMAILLLFPTENGHLRSQLIGDVYWSVDILAKVGQQNTMAQSANGVLKTLVSRLGEGHIYTLQHSNHNNNEGTTKSLHSGAADSRTLDNNSHSGIATDELSLSNFVEPSSLFPHEELSTTSTISSFDVETLLPPHPVGDLFYQDLYVPETLQGAEIPANSIQFDGNDEIDSFWSFISHI